MGPLQQSFEKMGIDSRDVTMGEAAHQLAFDGSTANTLYHPKKAIVAFNAGLYVSYGACFAFCWGFQPFQRIGKLSKLKLALARR